MSGWWPNRPDAVTGDIDTRPASPLPRVSLERYRHRCPDGTWVRATAQYIGLCGVTLYRFTIDGVDAGRATGACQADVPPDWTVFDVAHAPAATAA